MSFFRQRNIFLILAIAGLVISGYLFFRHLALFDLSIGRGADFCSVIFKLCCDEVLKSPIANLLGIPLAGWGIIYYISILAMFLLGDFLKENFKEVSIEILLFTTSITAIISLIFILSFIINFIPFCPLCFIIHLINISLVFVVSKLLINPISDSYKSLFTRVKEFFVTKEPLPKETKSQIIPILLTIALGLIIYQWVFVQTQRVELLDEYSFDELHFFEEYGEEEFVEIPVSENNPTLGSADALVNMVIFSDFECPGCRKLSEQINGLLSKYKTELNIVFINYPLSTKCNSTLKGDLHPNACLAAYAAEAANKQGKFWEYHDLLFSSEISSETNMYLEYAEELGLNISKFTYDLKTTAHDNVSEDIELGNELGIDTTPTVYVNGKKVSDIRMRALDWLVETINGIMKNKPKN